MNTLQSYYLFDEAVIEVRDIDSNKLIGFAEKLGEDNWKVTTIFGDKYDRDSLEDCITWLKAKWEQNPKKRKLQHQLTI